MTILQPIIDFKSVKEVKDLPVCWVSTHKADIKKAGEYEKQCKASGKTPSSEEIANLLGNNIVHLRQHTLENGISYVTIHQEDGTEIHDDSKYGGLFTCNCGAIHDSPHATSAIWDLEKKPGLGEGFKLIGTHASDNPERYGAIESFVEKEYAISNTNVSVNYSIRPPYKEDRGYLYFGFQETTSGPINIKLLEIDDDGKAKWLGKYVTERTTAKQLKIIFWSNKRRDHIKSEITIGHNLAENLFKGNWDQVSFEFNNTNKLEKITGISQSHKPNPEWKNEPLLTVIKKGMNEWFEYKTESPQARVLTQAIFGQDITRLQYNTKESLNSLIEAAIKETDIDLTKTLKFL